MRGRGPSVYGRPVGKGFSSYQKQAKPNDDKASWVSWLSRAKVGPLRVTVVVVLFVIGLAGFGFFDMFLSWVSVRQSVSLSLTREASFLSILNQQSVEDVAFISERKKLGLDSVRPVDDDSKQSIRRRRRKTTQNEYDEENDNILLQKTNQKIIEFEEEISESEHMEDIDEEESEAAAVASSASSTPMPKDVVVRVPDMSPHTGMSFAPPPQLVSKVPRTFVYFRGQCTSFCKSLIRAGYRLLPGMTSPAHPEFVLISYKSLSKYQNVHTSIVNQVGYGSSCIGGGKGKQLLCKEVYAKANGCEYSSLGVQPEQWNIRYPESCRTFFAEASKPENLKQIWIVKPGGSFHGSGIKLYEGMDTLRKKFSCSTTLPDGVIVQRYIAKPALFSGHKFDFRTYMLIASMDPFVVFYHDGFIRKSEHTYDTSSADLTNVKKHITNDKSQSNKDHFYSFQQLQDRLTEESGFPSDFMRKKFVPHAMRTTNFMFHAATKFSHRKTRFQLFALDWMLDSDGGIHLLEANGNPALVNYPIAGNELTPAIWTTMLDLVHLIQVEPDTLSPGELSAEKKYAFRGWKLVYNELELDYHKKQHGRGDYDPCLFQKYKEEKDPLFSFE